MDRLSPLSRSESPESRSLSPVSSLGSFGSEDSFESVTHASPQVQIVFHKTELERAKSQIGKKLDLPTLTYHEPTEAEQTMLAKTYGATLSARLLRQKHQRQLEELVDLSISLHEHPANQTKRGKKLVNTELQLVDTLRFHAQKIIELETGIQAQREKNRSQNHQIYQNKVAVIRDLIKHKASESEIAAEIGDLQAYDESLEKEYEGQDPYPSKSIAQSGVDWAKGWFTDIDSRSTPNQLVIEYSLARLGLKSTSDVYVKVLGQLKNLLLSPIELARSSVALLGDLKSFVLEHPMPASQMAGQLAHLANLLSGDETVGAALQTLIFKQRMKYCTQDLLTGKKNQHSYEEECKHPLNLRQLALLQVISGLPYVVAAYEGSQGRTLGGSLGYQALGAPGGILGGLAHAKAQEVLAESLNRDIELFASSAATFSNLPEHLRKSFINLQEAYSCLDISYDGVLALEKVYGATFKRREQLQKAGDFIRNIRKKGVQEAIQESAKTTFPKETTAAGTLFAYNLYKFAKTLKLLPESLVSQLPEELYLEFLTKPIEWAKLPDKRPELILKLIKPVLPTQTNVFLEDFFKLRRATLLPIRKLSESAGYAHCTQLVRDTITEQAQIWLSDLHALPI